MLYTDAVPKASEAAPSLCWARCASLYKAFDYACVCTRCAPIVQSTRSKRYLCYFVLVSISRTGPQDPHNDLSPQQIPTHAYKIAKSDGSASLTML